MLAEAVLAALIQTCSPDVGYSTMRAIVRVESGGNPWAINSNTLKRSFNFETRDEAELAATQMLRRGHNIDMGLGQVNSRNLPGLGLSVSQIFEPCRNLTASAKILKDAFASSWAIHYAKGEAMVLRHAISRYNTGNDWNGMKNGYVAKVEAAALGKSTAMAVAPRGAGGPQKVAYATSARQSAVVWSRQEPLTGGTVGGVQSLGSSFVLN